MKSTILRMTRLTANLVAVSPLAFAKAPLSFALIAALLLSTAPMGAQEPTDDWSRVVSTVSDVEVLVTVRGSKPRRCTFVQADESVLIVRTGRWQAVQMIARGDVEEVRTGRSRKRRALGLLGGFGGAIGGVFVGGLVGAGLSNGEDLSGLAIGMNVGAVGGAILGYRAATHTTGDLIYRAP